MADKNVKAEHDSTWTMPVPDAGKKYFNLGRSASFATAKRGEIPTMRFAHRLVAVVPAIERMLQADVKKDTA